MAVGLLKSLLSHLQVVDVCCRVVPGDKVPPLGADWCRLSEEPVVLAVIAAVAHLNGIISARGQCLLPGGDAATVIIRMQNEPRPVAILLSG